MTTIYEIRNVNGRFDTTTTPKARMGEIDGVNYASVTYADLDREYGWSVRKLGAKEARSRGFDVTA